MISGVSSDVLLQSNLITSSTVSPWDDVLIPKEKNIIQVVKLKIDVPKAKTKSSQLRADSTSHLTTSYHRFWRTLLEQIVLAVDRSIQCNQNLRLQQFEVLKWVKGTVNYTN